MALAQRRQAPSFTALAPGLGIATVTGHAVAWATGLVTVAAGMHLANDGRSSGGALLFWLGLSAMFLPLAWRALSPSSSWSTVLSALLALALGLYLVKVLRTPGLLTFHDEFMHWRTAKEIADGGDIFALNPLNPPSARYPGLELVTNAMAGATGLSLGIAGMIVIGLAKIGLIAALASALRLMTDSARGAALGCLVYLGNPLLLFWSSQFAYESLAVPLAVLCLLGTIVAATAARAPAWAVAVSLAAGAGVVVTHHLTSWLLTIVLLVGAAWVRLWRRAPDAPRVSVWPFLVSGAVVGLGAVAWLITVAWTSVSYVAPPIRRGFGDAVGVLLGDSSSRRQLFASPGTTPPTWERVVAVLSVLIVTGAVLIAAVRMLRTRSVGPLIAGGTLVALLYPASVGLRLAQGGQELANRLGALLFFAVAVSVAAGIAVSPRRRNRVLVFAAAAIVFAGGVVTGFARYARLPGPYLVSAGPRSIDPASLQATFWIRAAYGPGRRVAATSTQALLLGSYGLQRPLSAINSANMSPLFFSAFLGPSQRALIRDQRVELVVPDVRVTQQPPQDRAFVESGEPLEGQHRGPLPRVFVDKYDTTPGIDRRFDNGAVRVYYVRGLWP